MGREGSYAKDLPTIVGEAQHKMKSWWVDLLLFVLFLVLLAAFTVGLSGGTLPAKDAFPLIISLVALTFSGIGLYLTSVRPFLRRPRLKPSTNIQRSDPTDADMRQGAGRSWFIRLRIENTGQSAAKSCVGRLIEVQREGRGIERFDPLNLYWARQSEPAHFQTVDIQGNRDFFYLDVAQIAEAGNRLSLRVVIPEGQRLALSPGLPIGPELPEGTYFVRIGIYAEGAYIEPTWFKLEWKADYSADPPCRFEQVRKPGQ